MRTAISIGLTVIPPANRRRSPRRVPRQAGNPDFTVHVIQPNRPAVQARQVYRGALSILREQLQGQLFDLLKGLIGQPDIYLQIEADLLRQQLERLGKP